MWWCGVVTFKHGLPLQPDHHKTLTFVEALQKPLIWEPVGGWGHVHAYVPNLHRHGHHLVFVSCIFMDKGRHTRSRVFTGRHTETYRADTHKQTHTAFQLAAKARCDNGFLYVNAAGWDASVCSSVFRSGDARIILNCKMPEVERHIVFNAVANVHLEKIQKKYPVECLNR